MALAGLAVLVAAIGGLGSRPAAHDRISQVTWTIDVEPILKTRCLGCHTAGGFGTMPLDTYQEARTAARAIREAVLERRMPPWPAAPGFGDFSNDRSLTPLEIELLTAWADGGTPLGRTVVAARKTTGMVPGRPPDLVLTVPTAHAVSALTARFELPTGLVQDRWIAGWEFIPGNRSIIEQAVLRIAPAMLVGAWTPPETAFMYPDGVGQRLPAGSRLLLEVRYRKSPAPEIDQSDVALYFGRPPRRELRHRLLRCGTTVIDRNIEARAILPRTPSAGDSIEIVARRPNGTVEALCVLRRFEPGYPITYRFRHGIHLPRGTVLQLRSTSPGCSADLDFVAAQ